MKFRANMRVLPKDEAGRLWSEELKSWLVVELAGLQLYSADGQFRISRGDELKQARTLQADTEAVLLKAARLAEKLCELGSDPDE